MNRRRLLVASECWVKLLLALYPRRFREEVGAQVVEAYRDRCVPLLEMEARPLWPSFGFGPASIQSETAPVSVFVGPLQVSRQIAGD